MPCFHFLDECHLNDECGRSHCFLDGIRKPSLFVTSVWCVFWWNIFFRDVVFRVYEQGDPTATVVIGESVEFEK